MDSNGRLLLNLLSATSLRAETLAGNIANQNVPGYKRREVEFESLLIRELSPSAAGSRGTQSTLAEIQPRVVTDLETPSRVDGNNVFIEEEVNAMKENRMLFEIYASILSSRMNLVQRAIQGDR